MHASFNLVSRAFPLRGGEGKRESPWDKVAPRSQSIRAYPMLASSENNSQLNNKKEESMIDINDGHRIP